MKNKILKNKKGFTLIELLVVIGILAVLLAIVLIAINPARQFAQANNTKRRNDSLQILNAVWQYAADNNGQLPTGIPVGTNSEIGSGVGQADICAAIVPTYMNALPTAPELNVDEITNCATTYETNYDIVQSSSSSRVTVRAMQPELGETIEVSR